MGTITDLGSVKQEGIATDTKSYSFTSFGVGAGIYYLAGYYDAPVTDANLNEISPTIVLGVANLSYAAHAFLVAGGPGAVAGGIGAVEIEISGTSIDDLMNRVPGDTEIIVADITTLALNQFLETAKKWIGQIVYTVQNAAGGTHTTFSVVVNYGYNKYEDFGNRNFIVRDFEAVGLGSANDNSFDIKLLKQDTNNWTYSAAAFVPGGTILASMQTTHVTESEIGNTHPFAYKRSNMVDLVNGEGDEGIIVEITTGANNTVQAMDIHVGVEVI